MKSCDYCGKENEDAATACVECGTESFKTATTTTTIPAGVASTTSGLRIREISSDPAKLFRALVIISTGAGILSAFTPYVESRFMSYDTLNLLNYNGYGALITMPMSIYWLNVLINVAVAVGLYHFSAAARAVFAIFIVAYSVLALLFGVTIISPVVCFLGWVIGLADGAILVLAYATPLKERFTELQS